MNHRKRFRLPSAVLYSLLALCANGDREAFAQVGGEPRPAPPPASPTLGARIGDRDRKQPARRTRQKTASPDAPAARDEGPAGRLVEEGLRHAEARDWAAAIGSYRAAIAANPRHAEAHIMLGDAYMSSGKYEEAFAAYRAAIRVAPSNAEAHYALGAAYNDMAQYGDAFKPLVRAIQLAPDHAEAHYGIGYAYLKLENFRDALPYLKRAAASRPDFAEAHLSLGLAYLGVKQTKAAEQQLRLLEPLDAELAKELDAEIRNTPGLAAATAPPTATATPTKSVEQPSQEANTRGLKLAKTTTDDRETPSATTPPPPKTEADAKPARDSSPRPPRAAPVAQPTQPARQTAQPSAASTLAVELSFWDSIKNSSDPDEFAAYLKKYPKGEFAELAAIRLRALGAKRGDAAPTTEATPLPTPISTPTPIPTPTPTPVPTPDPLAETLKALQQEFPNKFTYKATAPGADPGVVSVTSEVLVEYEPLQFDSCRLEWRDTKDVLSVPLAELDPAGLKVEARTRPDTTYSIKVWNLSLSTLGERYAIREFKGDGSGAVNNYNGLDLQFDKRDKADKLARLLRTAIKLCADGQKN